jgi:uridine kinase
LAHNKFLLINQLLRNNKLSIHYFEQDSCRKLGYNKRMNRIALIETVAKIILAKHFDHPLRVAVDGVDASGKTTFVDELTHTIKKLSSREVIHISVDDFHHPNAIRKIKGDLSPEGFYLDSYNYQALKEQVLIPLGPIGNRQYRSLS